MPVRWSIGLAVVLAAALVTLSAPPGASARPRTTVTLSATGFADITSTRVQQFCPPGAGETLGWQERNGIATGMGSLVGDIVLPDGATITRFAYSFVDDTARFDTSAYLTRRRVTAGPASGHGASGLLASVASSGSSSAVRQVADSSIVTPRVDNETYAYFAEIVSCSTTAEDPFPPSPHPIARAGDIHGSVTTVNPR